MRKSFHAKTVREKVTSRKKRDLRNPSNKHTKFCYSDFRYNPAGNYLFKVNHRNTRTRYEICFYSVSMVSMVNFEQVIAGWERINNATG